MRAKKVLKGGLFVVVVGSALQAGIRLDPGTVHNILIDLSRPSSIEQPFQVVAVGVNGEPGLWIGPNVGRGWHGEAGGQAVYNVYVPADGKYHTWVYCLWHDECTNAIYAQFDGQRKMIAGNDSVFDEWHWVRAFSVDLSKGMHRLVLSNHSDNIAVRKLYLTSAFANHPQRNAPLFVDLFYDSFNGCDDGNFVLWEKPSGRWHVEPLAAEKDFLEKILIGRSDKTALMTFKSEDWREYVLNVSVRSVRADNPRVSVGICFGLTDVHEYHQLRWCEVPGSDLARMQLLRCSRGGTDVLASFETPWKHSSWHDVGIGVRADRIAIRIDGGKARIVPFSGGAKGGIGLWMSGRCEVHFDNIHVRTPGSGDRSGG